MRERERENYMKIINYLKNSSAKPVGSIMHFLQLSLGFLLSYTPQQDSSWHPAI